VDVAPTGTELERIRTHRDKLRERHLRPMADRPTSTARGVHHVALIDRGVEDSVYFRDPNGAPIELYREDLGTFDGTRILPG
jgi:glyoxylase I family protein